MLERAGLEVVEETAILFMPGWLRMLDLACHSWCRPLTALTGAFVKPFTLLDRYVPAVRRHGYLLATVATKRSGAHRPAFSSAPLAVQNATTVAGASHHNTKNLILARALRRGLA